MEQAQEEAGRCMDCGCYTVSMPPTFLLFWWLLMGPL